MRINWQFSLFLACGALLWVTGCASARVASTAVGTPAAPYIRAAHRSDGTSALEVAVRSLTPRRGRGPTVWLVGVTHLGTADYYGQLQRFLDAQTVVLFEGVGATNKSFARQDSGEFHLQAALAKALGLKFQLQAIDYTGSQFRNSDLSVAELTRILSSSDTGGESVAGEGGSGELGVLLDAMRGSGFFGALARITVALLEASPRLQAATQLVMVEVLAGLPDDLPQLTGLPPGVQRLLRVLIEERNAKVVEDVRLTTRTKPVPRSIAVLYGAGHMTDLEERLRIALGYQPGEEQWLTAMAVNPGESGLSNWELNLVQSWVRRALGELEPTSQSP